MIVEMNKIDAAKAHELLLSAISPLPVTLISTVSGEGVYNAAPFSAVAPVSWKPPLFFVSIGSKNGIKKDTAHNIESTGDFVVNIMSEEFIKATVRSSANYPSDVNEIERVGLTSIPAKKVKSPLIKEAQINIECQLYKKIELGEGEDIRWVYFGEIIIMHMKDEILTSGEIDPLKLGAVGYLGNRPLGKRLFCRTKDILKL